MAKDLNRPPVYITSLQARFKLPVLPGAGYSDAYLSLLRTVTHLRTLNVAEETLRDLWQVEKKLLQMLHVDSAGSPTWFLDACGQTTQPNRRLLLTNHDLGVEIHARTLQLGLNFTEGLPELFASKEMGEDALRVLGEYLKFHALICAKATAELPQLRASVAWTKRLLQAGLRP